MNRSIAHDKKGKNSLKEAPVDGGTIDLINVNEEYEGEPKKMADEDR